MKRLKCYRQAGDNQQGYTLVELVVVTAIFCIVMIITAKAFDRLITSGAQQTKTASSQIEGIVGLEMLRRDVGSAGYGLPWNVAGATYTENTALDALVTANSVKVDSAAVVLGDNSPAAPRAIAAGTGYLPGTTTYGSDYLVLKSVLLALPSANSSVGRWGSILFGTATTPGDNSHITPVNDAITDPRPNLDRVVTLMSRFDTTGQRDRQLIPGATQFYTTVPADYKVPCGTDPSQNYVAYAVSTVNPQTPYNRADYYISRPASNDPNFKMPLSCSSGTGILFKAVGDQANGVVSYPLLNCAGSMKVIYTLDMDGDGNAQTIADVNGQFSTQEADPSLGAITKAMVLGTLQSPDLLRQRVKSATVFILAHEGTKDKGYSYPAIDATNAVFVGPYSGRTALQSVGKMWTISQMSTQFGPEWNRYRWKVYSIPVTLENMQK